MKTNEKKYVVPKGQPWPLVGHTSDIRAPLEPRMGRLMAQAPEPPNGSPGQTHTCAHLHSLLRAAGHVPVQRHPKRMALSVQRPRPLRHAPLRPSHPLWPSRQCGEGPGTCGPLGAGVVRKALHYALGALYEGAALHNVSHNIVHLCNTSYTIACPMYRRP